MPREQLTAVDKIQDHGTAGLCSECERGSRTGPHTSKGRHSLNSSLIISRTTKNRKAPRTETRSKPNSSISLYSDLPPVLMISFSRLFNLISTNIQDLLGYNHNHSPGQQSKTKPKSFYTAWCSSCICLLNTLGDRSLPLHQFCHPRKQVKFVYSMFTAKWILTERQTNKLPIRHHYCI